MLSGVCNGLAAYFGIDVTPVRAIFVLFSLFTGGIGVVVYLVMMMVVPVAVTAEQMAAAHGKPFSAEELIGRPLGRRPRSPPAATGASNGATSAVCGVSSAGSGDVSSAAGMDRPRGRHHHRHHPTAGRARRMPGVTARRRASAWSGLSDVLLIVFLEPCWVPSRVGR